MDATYPNSPLQNLLTLQETAQKLGVTPEILLKWNDNHILSPKITLSGQIGYTEEQINQFLLIRQTLHHEPAEPIPSLPLQPIQPQIPAPYVSSAQKHTISRFSIAIAGISVVIGITILLTQQNKLLSMLNSFELSYRTPSNQIGQTSDAEITQPAAPLPSQNNGEKFHTQNTSALANVFAPTPTPAKKPSTKTSIATVKAVKGLQDEEASPSGANTETQDLSTLASVGTTGNQKSSTLNGDDITGNAPKSSTLATILGAGMVGNNSVFQEVNTDLRSQVLFLLTAGGLVFILFLTKRRSKPTPIRQEKPVYTEKIIELNQKMDGTVVLLFQGKEYKISKPELYSDSDRFFERLMQLMGPNTKEIEYDSLADTSKLITPLSRLVTRLGFVGIKRDLFFPRTSKNRVLFRKYLTREDLSAMNLTNDQIVTQLLQVS